MPRQVTGQLAEVIKEKQGVGRPKIQPPFRGRTKYTDDYQKYTKDEAGMSYPELFGHTVALFGYLYRFL